MDFARKQLEKYGWSEGKGLGKNENGIAEALKPKLKRSVTGVGYEPAKDFTEHWWSELYDKATSNVQVKEKNGKTMKMKAIDKEFVITNSTWRLKKKRNSHSEEEYLDFFVKTDILDNNGSKCVRVESESEEEDVVKMSDEELFKACGGRTAHKGARHGLRALGKLARIAQQEQELLQESRFQGYSHAKKIKETLNSDKETDAEKSKRKKKKKLVNDDIGKETLADKEDKIESQIDTDSSLDKVKRKNKLINNDDTEQETLADKEDKTELQIDTDSSLNKVIKKKKPINNDDIEQEILADDEQDKTESQLDAECSLSKVKKKNKRKNVSEDVETDDERKLTKKPKKKKKDKLLDDADETPKRISGLKVTLEIDEVLTKKVSKKKNI